MIFICFTPGFLTGFLSYRQVAAYTPQAAAAAAAAGHLVALLLIAFYFFRLFFFICLKGFFKPFKQIKLCSSPFCLSAASAADPRTRSAMLF